MAKFLEARIKRGFIFVFFFPSNETSMKQVLDKYLFVEYTSWVKCVCVCLGGWGGWGFWSASPGSWWQAQDYILYMSLSHSFFPPVPQGKAPEWVLENGGVWRLICVIGAWYLNRDLSTPKHELFSHQDDGGSHWLPSLSRWLTQCQAYKTWSWATALAYHFKEEAPKFKLFPPVNW